MNAGQKKDNFCRCSQPMDLIGTDGTLRHSDMFTVCGNINVYWYSEIDSTNLAAVELIKKGISDPTVIVADYQTSGRGRFERVWHSPAGKGLCFSIVQPYDLDIAAASQMTLLAAVAISEAVKNITGIRPGIKWPNDLMIRDKKICGILTEMVTDSFNGSVYLVIGIGLNINSSIEDMPEIIREKTTSLMIEQGTVINRKSLLNEILRYYTSWYNLWIRDGFGPVRDEWLKYNVTIGRNLEVNLWDEYFRGEAIGMDMAGSLEIIDSNNVVQKINSGEVSFIL